MECQIGKNFQIIQSRVIMRGISYRFYITYKYVIKPQIYAVYGAPNRQKLFKDPKSGNDEGNFIPFYIT